MQVACAVLVDLFKTYLKFVDFVVGHTEYEAYMDLQHVHPIARGDSIVLMDDCGCYSAKAWWCDGVNKAVAKVRVGCLFQVY